MKKVTGCIAALLILCMLSYSIAFAAEAPTTVQIMGPWVVESPEDSVLKTVVEGFEAAYPQYKVELIGVPSADVNKQVQAMAASKTLPDLVINNGANNAAWKEMGILENIEPKFSREFLDGFYPEMLEAFYYEGELYGLPTCAAPFVLLVRNDLLTEAGIGVPQNYEEILAAAKALTVDANGDGNVDRYGLGLMGFPDANTALRFILALFGAESPDVYVDEAGKFATRIGSPESLDAFKLYMDAQAEGVIPPGATEVDYKTMVSLLSTDQIAMAISGPHTIGNICVQNPEMEGKFIAVPLTGRKTVAYLNPYGFVKFAGSPNEEGAIAFLEYAARNFVEMTRVTKRPPSRVELAEVAKEAAPEVEAILDCAQYNIELLNLPFRADIYTAVYEGVNGMMAGLYSTPEDAAEAMRAAVQAVLDEHN